MFAKVLAGILPLLLLFSVTSPTVEGKISFGALANSNIVAMQRYYATLILQKNLILVINDDGSLDPTMKKDRQIGYGEGAVRCMAQMKKKTTIRTLIMLTGTTVAASARLQGLNAVNAMANFNAIKADMQNIVEMKKEMMRSSPGCFKRKSGSGDMILIPMKQALAALLLKS
jgi:hypothetical protein